MEKIHLFEQTNSDSDYIGDIITEWIDTNTKLGEYELVRINELNKLNNVDIILFNAEINEFYINKIKRIIDESPGINICFFVSPKDISLIDELNRLGENNSNIGTILKPTQYSKASEFMDSVISRKKPVVFEDNSDSFDISEFVHN